MCSIMRFHFYRNVSHFTMYGQRPQEERTICSLWYSDHSSVTPGKVYTLKELLLLDTSIS